MGNHQRTTFADRERFVQLHQAGWSYPTIARECGWKVETVKKHCEYYEHDPKYEIIKTIGVLPTSASGWSKELNLISWNDRDPKYDLRDWSADYAKMGKGVTLSTEELSVLKELLNSMEL